MIAGVNYMEKNEVAYRVIELVDWSRFWIIVAAFDKHISKWVYCIWLPLSLLHYTVYVPMVVLVCLMNRKSLSSSIVGLTIHNVCVLLIQIYMTYTYSTHVAHTWWHAYVNTNVIEHKFNINTLTHRVIWYKFDFQISLPWVYHIRVNTVFARVILCHINTNIRIVNVIE